MTPNIAISKFFPEVNPSVLGCPEALMTNAIRNACIEFCIDTLYWQETLDPTTLAATDLPYSVEAPSNANVAQIMTITVEGSLLTPKSADWLDTNYPGWATATADTPVFYYMPDPNNLVLVPAPTTTVDVVMRVAYTPTRDAATVPGTLHQYYLEGIAAGALMRLFGIPGQPWYDASLVDHYGRAFSAAVTNGVIDANKSYDRTGIRVQMRSRC